MGKLSRIFERIAIEIGNTYYRLGGERICGFKSSKIFIAYDLVHK